MLRTGPRAGMDYMGHEAYGGQRGDTPRRFSITLKINGTFLQITSYMEVRYVNALIA